MKRFFRRSLLAVALVAACRRPRASHPVVVLTTQGVTPAGITRALAGGFHRETAVPVEIHNLTVDEILRAAGNQSGAVAIYRNPELDTELLRRHAIELHNVFAYEDYVIAGPRHDPAHIAGAKTAGEAFARIVKRRRLFCSPVDLPVLLDVEREIWTASDEKPPKGSRYRPCHGNAAEVLAQAGALSAYTVTDRATAEATLPKQLKVLMRDGPILHSAYVIALLDDSESAPPKSSEWFVEWVMSTRGRDFIHELHSSTVPRLYLPGGP